MPGRDNPKQRSVRRRKRTSPAVAALKRVAPSKLLALTRSRKKQLIERRIPPQRVLAGDKPQLKGLCLLNISTLSDTISSHAICAKCSGRSLHIEEKMDTRRGLVTSLSLVCQGCHSISKLSDPYSDEAKLLNRSSVYAMRFAGGGLHSLEKFCGLMCLPPPITDNSYAEHQAVIAAAAMKVAMESCKEAADELHQLAGKPCDEIVNITVTCDGTWATRGFTSKFGVVIVMSFETGRILDFEVLSKYCHQCALHSGDDTTSSAYLEWWEEHEPNCAKNFQGSSPAMESQGALILWKRSKEQLNLQYTTLISDGDAKTHSLLNEENPYDGVEIEKNDCVGHVQKRMGSRLRKKKKEGIYDVKKQKVIGLGGQGRLTEAVMDNLQNYYGKAIRENAGNVQKMKDAVWAIYYPTISTDKKPQHKYCPKGKESWCKYNKAAAVGMHKSYKHRKTLPKDVADAIYPMRCRSLH